MQCLYLALLLWAGAWSTLSFARQNSRLFYYETLSKVSVKTRARRSSSNDPTIVKELHFNAFQRSFHLSLTSGSSVLARGFRARMIHGDGSSIWFSPDQSKIFTGRVISSPKSVVSAYLEGDLWNIHILERGETYAVEPAWRLLSQGENRRNDTMVSYRLSDVRNLSNKSRFCSAVPGLNTSRENDSLHLVQDQNKRRLKRPRKKRHVQDTCVLNAVGDASLFNGKCRRDYLACSSMVINYINVIDNLFRASKFESSLGTFIQDIGIQIGRLTLYTEHSAGSAKAGEVHFNEKQNFDAPSKLGLFAKAMSEVVKPYCLHHLFSEFRDPNGIVGRAYENALCLHFHGKKMAFNSAITSEIDQFGNFLPTLRAIYDFAHETGHNFGSTHDPDTRECAPELEQGGKYLMWSYVMFGYGPNNQQFSNCSLRQIGRHVPAPCFKPRSEVVAFCGNGLVDAGEDCDEGAPGLNDMDNCCDKRCKFRGAAECSDNNNACCRGCRIAPANTVCRYQRHLLTCLENSVCTGDSPVCPKSEMLADGEKCGPVHACFNGRCLDPCMNATASSTEGYKYLPCSCSNPIDMCKYCCYRVTKTTLAGECQVFSPQPKPDGAMCDGGLCQNGECRQYKPHSVILLYHYIQYVQASSFEQLMRGNIVLAVVFLSLILWVPPSLVIHRIDVRERAEWEVFHEMKNQLVALGVRNPVRDEKSRLETSRTDVPITRTRYIKLGPNTSSNPVDPKPTLKANHTIKNEESGLKTATPDVEKVRARYEILRRKVFSKPVDHGTTLKENSAVKDNKSQLEPSTPNVSLSGTRSVKFGNDIVHSFVDIRTMSKENQIVENKKS